MKIKSLQMFGFKSFGDRTALHFDRQIVGVVGPNGCGKSNIVDAIRWVMGEQSAKGLRGNEMSDVIFNGTGSRKKGSFAEVSLTFDNADKLASAPYTDCAEIMITRRLFRSGESEYLINKVPVRLKDITDLFLGTGSSARAYSIVAQGKVDQIVLAKPEDRRFLLEEAAGVAKYKVRKISAERKMEATKTNLERVHDILKELERNSRYLEKQVGRAEEFRKIQTELRKLDEQVIAAKVTRLDRDARESSEKRDSARFEFEKSSTDFSQVDVQIESLRFEALNFEKASSGDYERLIHLKEKFSELDKEMELSSQRVSLLDNQIKEREKDLERIRAKSLAHTETIQQVIEARDKLKIEWEEKKIAIEVQKAALKTLEEKIQSLDFDGSQIRTDIEAKQKQAAKDSQKKEMLLQERVNQEFRRAEIEQQIERFVLEEGALVGLHQEEENKYQFLLKENEALEKAQVELQDSLAKLANLDSEFSKERARLQDEFHQCESEIKSLNTLEEHKAGYDLGALERKARTGLPLVMDKISFKPEFQKVADTFLSDFGQYFFDNIGTEDSETSLRWSRILEQTSEVPPVSQSLLSCVEGEVPEPLKKFLASVEVVERLSENPGEFIQIDFSGAMNLPISSGFLVQSRGVIRRSETPFGRQTELARYKGERERIREAITVLEQKIEDSQIATRALKTEIENLRLTTKENSIQRGDAKARVVKIEGQRDAMRDKREKSQTELSDLDIRLLNLSAEIQTITHSADLQEAEQKLQVIDEELSNLRSEKTKADSEWIESRISFGALEERLDRLQQQSVHVEMTKSEYSHNENLFESDIKIWREEIQRESKKAGDARTQKDLDIVTIRDLEAKLSENREKLTAVRSELEHLEVSRKAAFQIKESAQKILQDLELEHQRLKFEVEELSQLVEVRYHISLQDVLAQVTEKDLERLEDPTVLGALEVEAKELREKVESFGEVNLLALNEFEEINKRLQFMTAQREDLLKTLDSLQSIIDRINKITEMRFRETFKAINHNFQFLFPKLFGGGKAFMTLTNEQNLLETGIEIFAEPPGKKVQSMSLLSGGEKAMTSISLLFALFAYRPASFCILDEVDAPLDEINTFRYNSIIREMASLSQFIVITHNKRTMEVADTLFGVTMQDPGVSQIVGVQLQEARAFVA